MESRAGTRGRSMVEALAAAVIAGLISLIVFTSIAPWFADGWAGGDMLATHTPNVIALYGKSMEAVMRFWESIPKENDPTAPICYDYAWPIDPSTDFPTTQGHTCLTRLTWRS